MKRLLSVIGFVHSTKIYKLTSKRSCFHQFMFWSCIYSIESVIVLCFVVRYL